MIVTGLAKNAMEIYTVLKGYIPEEEKDLTYEAFVLEHVSALAAEKMVRDLFGMQARGVGNVSEPRCRFAAAMAARGGSSRCGSSGESR